jgi:hypothetical protein
MLAYYDRLNLEPCITVAKSDWDDIKAKYDTALTMIEEKNVEIESLKKMVDIINLISSKII